MKHIDLRDKMPGSFHLYLVGDTHIGNMATDWKALRRMNTHIKGQKHAYWAGGGDTYEAISVDDPRFNADVHNAMEARMNFQIDAFVEDHEQIADKLLWMLLGNHEYALLRKFDMIHETAVRMGLIDRSWGIRNGRRVKTYSSYLAKVLFPGFRLMDWHGSGVVQSYARDAKTREVNEGFSIKKKLARLPGDDCEILVMHHIHKARLHPPDKTLTVISTAGGKLREHYLVPSRIWVDEKRGMYRIPEDERFYCSSGSVLRAYMEDAVTYTEVKGYRPSEMGFIHVEVRNDKIRDVSIYKP